MYISLSWEKKLIQGANVKGVVEGTSLEGINRSYIKLMLTSIWLAQNPPPVYLYDEMPPSVSRLVKQYFTHTH